MSTRTPSARGLGRRQRRRIGTGFAYVIAIGAVLLTLFPLYWLFVISTKTPREAFETPPALIYVPDFSRYFSIAFSIASSRASSSKGLVR